MKSPNDDTFEEHLRQFLERAKYQEAYYRQAAAYLGARRVVQDLQELNQPHVPIWRRVHPLRVMRQMQHLLHRLAKPARPEPVQPEPDYIDAEIISVSDDYPSVIIIPPQR